MTELVKSRIGTYAGVFKDLSRVNHRQDILFLDMISLVLTLI